MTEAPWLSLMDLPIGDHRELVVELRGALGECATGYWSGQDWRQAPVAADSAQLDFRPIEYRATPRIAPTAPAGDYAIVEVLGHRTLVGRTSEVERFGTKLLAIEPIWQGELLPAVLIGGSSIYAFTPCTADVAFRKQATRDYELPSSLRAVLPPAALPAPAECADWDPDEDPNGDAPEFAPAFLTPIGGDAF